ncbi:unnamed protein product, partial [Nesidiocoris tenuis]
PLMTRILRRILSIPGKKKQEEKLDQYSSNGWRFYWQINHNGPSHCYSGSSRREIALFISITAGRQINPQGSYSQSGASRSAMVQLRLTHHGAR